MDTNRAKKDFHGMLYLQNLEVDIFTLIQVIKDEWPNFPFIWRKSLKLVN